MADYYWPLKKDVIYKVIRPFGQLDAGRTIIAPKVFYSGYDALYYYTFKDPNGGPDVFFEAELLEPANMQGCFEEVNPSPPVNSKFGDDHPVCTQMEFFNTLKIRAIAFKDGKPSGFFCGGWSHGDYKNPLWPESNSRPADAVYTRLDDILSRVKIPFDQLPKKPDFYVEVNESRNLWLEVKNPFFP